MCLLVESAQLLFRVMKAKHIRDGYGCSGQRESDHLLPNTASLFIFRFFRLFKRFKKQLHATCFTVVVSLQEFDDVCSKMSRYADEV